MNLDDLMVPPAGEAAPQKPQKVWSPQQLAIYTAGKETDDNLLIEAVAGSGKSTTIEEMTKRSMQKSLFLAFNKAIAEELRSRIHGDVRTLNALGHRVLMSKRPGAQLNVYKTLNWLRSHMSPDLYEGCAKEVARIVSLAKGSGFDIRTPSDISMFRLLVDNYLPELEPEKIESVARLGQTAFHGVLAEKNEFDFDDQLYVPIKEGWTFPAYAEVYVDECQDLNPIQHMMLEALQLRGARIIGVGDRRQAIYAFRGASSNSMDLMQETFQMKEYPLSITYRCSQAVTRLAQSIVPQIEHRPNAPEGEVRHLDQYPEVEVYSNSDLIVCRNNAPIFSMALQFIKARKQCRVFSNFLGELDKFIQSFKTKDIGILIARLEAWYAKQKSDCEDRGQWGKLEGLTDKYDTLRTFAPEFQSVPELLQAIYRLANSTIGPILSTVHKAKGLEAENTYLLRWDLLPSPRAVSDEAITQEDNLRYVAITRAKLNLRILPLGD